MKSLYIILLLLGPLCVHSAFSQSMVLEEGFNSGSLPSGWTKNQAAASVGWEFGDAATLSSSNLNFPGTLSIAASNDDKNDNVLGTLNFATRDMLVSPSFGLVGLSSARLQVKAYHTGASGSTATIEASTDGGNTWNVIYTLTGKTEWQDLSIDLSAYLGNASMQLAFVHNDGGASADGFGIDYLKIFEPVPHDLSVEQLHLAETGVIGAHPVTITITNRGTAVLNSFVFSWADNSNQYHAETVDGLGLVPGASLTITHNKPYVELSDGISTIRVKTTLPNGYADLFPSDNDGSAVINIKFGTSDNNVLVEQYTGAWCSSCPQASIILRDIMHADSSVIGISIHNNDAMSFPDGNTIDNILAGANYPKGSIDRVKFVGQSNPGVPPSTWTYYVLQRKLQEPLATIGATSSYDPLTRELTVSVSTQFLVRNYGPYSLNVAIVEDSVVGVGNGYNQANAYNSVPGHPYQGAGNPIVGYPHRFVARHYMGGPWGQTGIMPNTPVPLTPYTHTFTFTLPSNWDADKIFLVAMVKRVYQTAQFGSREVLNSIKLGLNDIVATNLVVADGIAIDLVNIAHDVCGESSEGQIEVVSPNCTGCTFEWSNGQSGNIATGLSPGAYTVTMVNASGKEFTQIFTIYGPLAVNPTIDNNSGDVAIAIAGGSPPYQISWSNGSTGDIQTGLAPGVYQITIVDDNGCTTVHELKIESVVSVNDVTMLDFHVKPNPTTGVIVVEAGLTQCDHVTIQVFNTLGSLVSERSLNGLAQVREVVDLSTEANGIYIVKVTADGTTGVQRLVLNR